MDQNQNDSAKSATAEQLKGDLPQRVEEAQAKGYFGSVPDPTPNEAYTLSGVTSGAATPETDEQAAEDADQRSAELSTELDSGQSTDHGAGESTGEQSTGEPTSTEQTGGWGS